MWRGQVSVSAELADQSADRSSLFIRVRDSGIGIADTLQGRLFQPFQQVDGAATRRYGGMGLSLAISKRVIERRGGTISVVSVAGQGATFLGTGAFPRSRNACPAANRRDRAFAY